MQMIASHNSAGAGDPTEPGAAGAGGSGACGARAGGAAVLGVPSSTSLTPSLLCPPPDQSQQPLQPASPLPAPSPYTEQSGGLTECREPAAHLVSHVRTSHRVPHSRPPPLPVTHAMALRPTTVPSDGARTTSPTAVSDPSFESGSASALVVKRLEFAAACCLDYATALVAESEAACPPSVGGECALGTDVLEDRQEDFECLAVAVPRFASMLLAPEGGPDAPDISTPHSYAEAITGPFSSQWQAPMDAEMTS
ncbi:unnamed protein product [Closterium sp. NIES-53]